MEWMSYKTGEFGKCKHGYYFNIGSTVTLAVTFKGLKPLEDWLQAEKN
jgi:hypothetical protein